MDRTLVAVQKMLAALDAPAYDIGVLSDRGMLVPPGNAPALAAAIEDLLADPARAAVLGKRARAWSRSHLRMDQMVDQHIRIYSDLLEPQCVG